MLVDVHSIVPNVAASLDLSQLPAAINQSEYAHSCGRSSVEKFLAGKDAEAIALYERFSALVHECGRITLAPAKTRIGLQVRMIFATQ